MEETTPTPRPRKSPQEKGVWQQGIIVPIALIAVNFLVMGLGISLYAATGYDEKLGQEIQAGFFTEPVWFPLVGLILCVLEILAYRFLVKLFAKRPVVELGREGAVKETAFGVGLGAGIVSLPMLLLWLGGHWHFDSVGLRPGIAVGIGIGLMACVFEELLFRGIMVRLMDLFWGPVWAIVLSTVVFGSMHLMNPGMTGLGVVALAIEAGPLLGAAYLWRHRLWLPIGLHFGWNAMQAAFWGVNVSGTGENLGLLDGSFTGPDWLTGGSVGIEGSLLTAVVALASAGVILWYSRKPNSALSEAPEDASGTTPDTNS